MKTKFLLFGMLLGVSLTFGQFNQSINTVLDPISLVTPPAPNEIFRFAPGNVTQLEGTSFDFTSSRWFSLGKVVTGANTAYGLRFQLPNKSVTFGYQSVASANPRIEWIGTGASLGNLEFRVANSFNSTVSKVVATMKSDGNTVFGDNVGSNTFGQARLQIGYDSNGQGTTDLVGVSIARTNQTDSALTSKALIAVAKGQSTANVGVTAVGDGSGQAFGLQGSGKSTTQDACGVFGIASTLGTAFECGVYGASSPNSRGGRFAGFFDGAVGVTGTFLSGSDAKLKDNIKQELSALKKIEKLRPVTYDFKQMSEINLPSGNQHGFIAQELATVFPELTEDIKKPVFDKDNLITSSFEYKAVNYMGLISILTAGIQELNNELKSVKQELADIKSNNATATANSLGFFMSQNNPNPFTDQTVITYRLPNGTTTAEIAIFDMTGKPVKSYFVSSSQTEVTIKSSDIGTGLFIYSLVQNGQELITKRLIVR